MLPNNRFVRQECSKIDNIDTWVLKSEAATYKKPSWEIRHDQLCLGHVQSNMQAPAVRLETALGWLAWRHGSGWPIDFLKLDGGGMEIEVFTRPTGPDRAGCHLHLNRILENRCSDLFSLVLDLFTFVVDYGLEELCYCMRLYWVLCYRIPRTENPMYV